MTQQITTDELDHFLAVMIQCAEGVSDLLFIAGRPPQVEAHGKLVAYAMQPPESVLTSGRIEVVARAIIGTNARLLQDLSERGSCDCSYSLASFCRFRVNIYRQ